jgi:hypothetical protein
MDGDVFDSGVQQHGCISDQYQHRPSNQVGDSRNRTTYVAQRLPASGCPISTLRGEVSVISGDGQARGFAIECGRKRPRRRKSLVFIPIKPSNQCFHHL